jgi:hypothetical protein
MKNPEMTALRVLLKQERELRRDIESRVKRAIPEGSVVEFDRGNGHVAAIIRKWSSRRALIESQTGKTYWVELQPWLINARVEGV